MNWIKKQIEFLRKDEMFSLEEAHDIIFSYIEENKELAEIMNNREIKGEVTENNLMHFFIDVLTCHRDKLIQEFEDRRNQKELNALENQTFEG